MNEIIIEAILEGSFSVRIAGRLFDFSKGKHPGRGGVLPRAARKLIAEGANPTSILRATRGGTLVFTEASLRHWAGISIEERGDRSVRIVPFRSHSGSRAKEDDGEVAIEWLDAA